MAGNQLGRNIQHLRKLHKETLEELGNVIFCAKSTVKGYENGSREPDFKTLQRLAAHYNKSIDELLQVQCFVDKNKRQSITNTNPPRGHRFE